MADFCEACSKDLGFPRNDLSLITSEEDWQNGLACSVICEGCGIIQVDPDGNCVSPHCLKKGQPGHGLPWVSQKECLAEIHHGPGHQSSTRCCLTGNHKIHEARYGNHDQLARWKGDKVFSGYFDDPPEEPEECCKTDEQILIDSDSLSVVHDNIRGIYHISIKNIDKVDVVVLNSAIETAEQLHNVISPEVDKDE